MLDENTLKQQLLHHDKYVRQTVGHYLSESRTADASIMHQAITAIERFGRAEAFESCRFLSALPQSDETLAWVLDELCRRDEIDFSSLDETERMVLGYFESLEACLKSAEPVLLARHQAAIESLETIGYCTRNAVAEILQLAPQSIDELWGQLEVFCQKCGGDFGDDEPDFDHAARLVNALAARGAEVERRVLSLIARRPNEDDGPGTLWLEYALAMAAEMRLAAAVPLAADLLVAEDDFVREECQRLFARVGSEEAVNLIAAAYFDEEADSQAFAAWCLEPMHTDHAVATCLSLAPHACDTETQCFLLSAALRNFAKAAIEPARQFVLATPPDPEVLDVRSSLITACDVLGATIPELEEWRIAREGDREFRKQWYAELGWSQSDWNQPSSIDAYDGDFDEIGDAGYEDPDFDWSARPTIHNEQPRIGRNDPCPCGSGKKYKKCCLGKARENPLAN